MPAEQKAPNFNRNPMLWLAVAFAVGIAAAHFSNVNVAAAMMLTVLLAAAAALSARSPGFSRLFTEEGRLKAGLRTLFILAAFAFAGAASFEIETTGIADNRIRVLYDGGSITSGDPVEVEGVLAASPEAAAEGYFITVRTETITHRGQAREASGNVRLFVPASRSETVKYGSRIRVACRLEREDEYLNPGVARKRDILDRMGVDASGTLKSEMLIEHIGEDRVFLPLAWVYAARAKAIDQFRSNLSQPTAGVMIASLLGDKHFLDKPTADLFREGGTFHILIISGLHITFIGGLLLWLIRQFTRNRWIQFIGTTTVLWAYSLAVGGDVPVVRAAIMFTVISFSFVIYRQTSLLNSLGISTLLLLVWRPSDLFNPSFQLTFVSVAAILGMAYPALENLRAVGRWMPSTETPFPPNVPSWLKRFCEYLYWNPVAWPIEVKRQIWSANIFKSKPAGEITQKLARYAFDGIFVSLVVQIWMLPLLVVYFHRVSLIAIVLNLWVGFFIALESFAAVFALVAGNVSSLLASPFYLLAEAFNSLMLLLPRLFVDNSWASFRLPAYDGTGRMLYAAYFIPILLLAYAAYRWRPFDLKSNLSSSLTIAAGTALLVFAIVVISHPFSAPTHDGRLHVDFLDVGHGDSALITFPDGRTMLIDAGGRFDYRRSDDEPFEPDIRGVGEAVVSEVLWAKGYSHIDHILTTHAHADHLGGLNDIARNFTAGSFIFGISPRNDEGFAELTNVLHRRGIPVETVARGDKLEFGQAVVEVLYPSADQDATIASSNDNSVVLRIKYGSRSFLLTGDIESVAEAQLVRDSSLVSDVVKVPHHGSRTSSTAEFVNAVDAKYAVISAPRRSPFGHPHAEVVERWQAAGAKILTTGTSGMISISTDGSHLDVAEHARSLSEP